MRLGLGIPKPIATIFWAVTFLEATFGSYLSIWPLWIERLGAPVAVVGLLVGASGFLRLGVLIPSATIAERLGYRRAILLGRSISAAGLVTAALATHWTHLIVMVLATAVGEIVFPLAQSLVAGLGGEQRVRSFALVFSVGPSIALIIAPLISGALVSLWGMRAAFILAAVCTIISILFFSRVKEPKIAPTKEGEKPSSYRAAASDPAVRLVLTFLPSAVFALSLGASFVPVFLEDVRGMAPATIASLSSAGAIGSAAMGLAVARVPRLERAPFIAVAIVVGLTAVGFVLFRSTGAIVLVIVAFLFRGGLFSSWALLAAALGDLAPAAHRARAFALGEMAGGLAFALGPVVAGPLYAQRESLPLDAGTVLAVLLVPALLLAQRRATRLRARASTPVVPVTENA
ncbi:MAG TPA: MFS transporter [Thermomicrobiales bacterium]